MVQGVDVGHVVWQPSLPTSLRHLWTLKLETRAVG